MKHVLSKCLTLTISLNFRLSLLHLLHQRGVSDDASSIPDFSTGFVEASNDAHDRPLGYISQCRQLIEGLKYAISAQQSFNQRR